MHEPVVQRESGGNLNLLRLFAFLALIFGASPSIAGEMTFLKDLNMPPDSDPTLNPGCSHRYTGTVEKGDLAKFDIVRPRQTITVVCLNSTGGSFAEAIKIGEYMKEKGIGAQLEAGAQCLSACSLIFMSGSYYAHEVGLLYWRIMHPTAKLGFHVPSLVVEEGNYQKDSVEKAYQIAMRSISDMIFKLVQKDGFKGGNTMKMALIGNMISTPSDQMFMIDTVDKVGRWDIRIEPALVTSNLTDTQFYQACLNIVRWGNDESAFQIANLNGATHIVTRTQRNSATNVQVIADEFTGEYCNFELHGKFASISGTLEGAIQYGNIQNYIGLYSAPETKLVDLPLPNTQATMTFGNGANYLAANKFCTVIRNNRVVETHPCQKKPVIEKGIQYLVYTWQSGAKTVLETRADGQMSVNGSPFSPRENLQGHECYLNQNSGNHFCSRL
ncbi:MAG: hypothetical protein ABJN11_14580 [Lentilitoribacter sp.]